MSSDENAIREVHGKRTIRLVRPSVVVLCGPAACGKSTFASRHFRKTQVISSDQARGLICDDERDQRFHTQAFALVHFLIEQRLGINRLCVVDSTALTEVSRKSLLQLARKYDVPCFAFLFEVPLEVCIERDQSRERSVGAAVIERQYQLFDRSKSSILGEGFNQVIKVSDNDLDDVDIEVLFRPITNPSAVPARKSPIAGNQPGLASAKPKGTPAKRKPPLHKQAPRQPLEQAAIQPPGERQGIRPPAKSSAPTTTPPADQRSRNEPNVGS